MSSLAIHDPLERLQAISREAARRRFLERPDMWVKERLKEEIWSGQKRILESVRDHRKTAVKSCHEIGKSFIAARVVCWWIDSHPITKAFAVTTAPTDPQVEAVLWREIGRAHAKGNLSGRLNTKEWLVTPTIGKEEMVSFGRKPSDYNSVAFQGIHAPFVLVVLDEADGIPYLLYEAADSLVANDSGRVLAIGNPDNPTSHFAEICKPGSGWNVIEIGAFDTPNFTGEYLPKDVLCQLIGPAYVEEKRKQWAPHWRWNAAFTRVEPPPNSDPQDTDPLWQSKVLGKFPKNAGVQTLIRDEWILKAQAKFEEIKATRASYALNPRIIGVDVGAGGDSTSECLREGQLNRIMHEDHNPDTMETCGNIIVHLDEWDADEARIDSIGIGIGIVNRGQEQKKPFIGVNVGEAAEGEYEERDPAGNIQVVQASSKFLNKRAQYYWQLREKFEREDIAIDPHDLQLAREIREIRFKRTSSGKIQIEAKEELKKRLNGQSCNRLESLMLANAEVPEEYQSLTW
jgi:hypothetical protein